MHTYNHPPVYNLVLGSFFSPIGRLTPLAYKLLWDEIAAKFEDAGYWVNKKKQRVGLRASGLDASPKNPTICFLLRVRRKIPAIVFLGITTIPTGNFWTPCSGLRTMWCRFVHSFPKTNPGTTNDTSIRRKLRRLPRNCGNHSNNPGVGQCGRFFAYALALRPGGNELVL